MAINDTDTGDEQTEIIAQIGRLLPGLYSKPKRRPKTAELLESFDVWKLDTSDIREGIANNTFPAVPTGYRHHQIRINNKVQAYALSSNSPSEPHTVFKLAISKNAERIDKAIDRIEKKVDINNDIVARLLTVRSYSVYAFWLVGRKEVYVFSAPSHFKRIRPRTFLSESEFLLALQSEREYFKLKQEYKSSQ
jgi:hypothetical protein